MIRVATVADGPAIAAIYAPAITDRSTSFEVDPPSGEEMARRVAALVPRLPWLVCEHRGAVIGYAYGSPHRDRAAYRWSVEVSAYVDERVHRGGVGRALYTSLFEVLVLLGLRNAYAGITLPNVASVGLHEAVGFSMVGVYRGIGYKFGQWHDVAWLERALATRDADPAPPRPLADVLADPAAAQLLVRALASGLPLLHLPA